jgi:hypothetical protein
LEKWMADTRDLGGVAEEDLVQRGLIADQLEEYARRIKPLEIPLTPRPR